jgi:hypothetical protein
MGKLIGKYPNLALILIWVTLVGAVWLLPSEPRPQIVTARRAWADNLPPGMACRPPPNHRQASPNRGLTSRPYNRCRASEIAWFSIARVPLSNVEQGSR